MLPLSPTLPIIHHPTLLAESCPSPDPQWLGHPTLSSNGYYPCPYYPSPQPSPAMGITPSPDSLHHQNLLAESRPSPDPRWLGHPTLSSHEYYLSPLPCHPTLTAESCPSPDTLQLPPKCSWLGESLFVTLCSPAVSRPSPNLCVPPISRSP